MKIVMYLEKALIDSVKIEKDKISEPGYLSRYIRELREKHASLLIKPFTEPEFFLYPLKPPSVIDANALTPKLF